MSEEEGLRGGQLSAAISNSVVRVVAEYTGRGPTKARTVMGGDSVFVILQDTMTRGERTLVGNGEEDAVLDLRRRWQRAMREDLSNEVERLTGRSVIGFMSDNHIDPDLGAEIFILDSTEEPTEA